MDEREKGFEEIDLVYLWVNGNDPDWRKKKSSYTGETFDMEAVDCDGRYADNGELKYSLRSIEKYAPWIHRIFIVTDSQKPEWLDLENPKIQIIDHKDILEEEHLPTFNSVVLEHSLYKIPGLSEHFLYANDDMFLNRPVSPSDFFDSEGRPIVRLNSRPFRKLWFWYRENIQGHQTGYFNHTVINASHLVEKKLGKYIGHKCHHNIDAYSRSYCRRVSEDLFPEEIGAILDNHIRSDSDIQRCLISYAALAEKKGRRKMVTQHTSFRLNIHGHHLFDRFVRYNPVFFCVNDSEFASEEDRKRVPGFLENLFPEKSSFEL